MFLKNRNIGSKMKRSKVTDYAALMYQFKALQVHQSHDVDSIDKHVCDLVSANLYKLY